jgi:pimeloyl-ACP methyl ester carboxylesterase
MHLLFWLLLLPCVLLIGAAYQAVEMFRDRKLVAENGRLVHVGGGRRMFVSEKGSDGPTVIFESGITASSLHWADVQTSVSMVARTFTYDRLGLGWSSACTSARTPETLALELRTLLQEAGVTAPYVFVAHSFGGLIARQFAAEYADDVAGLVLLDPMRIEDWQPCNEFRQKLLKRGLRLMNRAVPLARIGLIRLAARSLLKHPELFSHVLGAIAGKGGQRIVERTTRELLKMPVAVRSAVISQWSAPDFYRGAAAYFRDVPASVREMQQARFVKNIPIIVLSPAATSLLPEDSLRRIGPKATQRVVHGSGHWVQLDRPDAVLDAIHCVLDEIQEQTLWEASECVSVA